METEEEKQARLEAEATRTAEEDFDGNRNAIATAEDLESGEQTTLLYEEDKHGSVKQELLRGSEMASPNEMGKQVDSTKGNELAALSESYDQDLANELKAESASTYEGAGLNALDYTTEEVLLKIPNNKGFGVRHGKNGEEDEVVFMTEHGDLMNAEEVSRTIDYTASIAEEVQSGYGLIMGNTMAQVADPDSTHFTPEDSVSAWMDVAKESGLISPDYDPKADVGVVDSGLFVMVEEQRKKILRTAASQLGKGSAKVDVNNFALAMLSDYEHFADMPDSAKIEIAQNLSREVHALSENINAEVMTKTMQRMGLIETEALTGIGETLSKLDGTHFAPLSIADQEKNRVEIQKGKEQMRQIDEANLRLRNERIKAVNEAYKARKRYKREKSAIERRFGGDEETARLAQLDQKYAKIFGAGAEIQAKMNDNARIRKSTKTEIKRLADNVIKGLPFKVTKDEIATLFDTASSAVGDVDLVTGSGKSRGIDRGYASLTSEHEKGHFILEHGMKQWYEEQMKIAPKKKVVYDNTVKSVMDAYAEGKLQSFDPAIHQRVQQKMRSVDAFLTKDAMGGMFAGMDDKTKKTYLSGVVQDAARATQIFASRGTSFTAKGDTKFVNVDTVAELESGFFKPLDRIAAITNRPDLKQKVAEYRAQANRAIEENAQFLRVDSAGNIGDLFDAEVTLAEGKITFDNLVDNMMSILVGKKPGSVKGEKVDTSFGFRMYYADKMMTQAANPMKTDMAGSSVKPYMYGVQLFKQMLGSIPNTETAITAHMEALESMKNALSGVESKEEAARIVNLHLGMRGSKLL